MIFGYEQILSFYFYYVLEIAEIVNVYIFNYVKFSNLFFIYFSK